MPFRLLVIVMRSKVIEIIFDGSAMVNGGYDPKIPIGSLGKAGKVRILHLFLKKK
jgi:hypothetical protein